MKQKGYIGAIGDDLPSLIPLFLGIVLFFAVFITTYNTYKTNTDFYSDQNEALRISLILKEEPLIISHDFFQNLCDKVDTKYNWTAFLIDVDLNYSNNQPLDLTKIKNYENNNVISYETSSGNIDRYVCGDIDGFIDLPHEHVSTKIINYMFPLTRQVEVNSIPVKLYVIVWS